MPTRISTARLDAGWKRTDEGFIDARVFITRPGVFPYWDEDLKKVVYELRSTEEVHKQAHLDSYLGKPFTNNHPPKMVKSDNYKQFETGALYGEHKIAEDGLHTESRVMVKDQDTCRDIEGGKTAVSAGYECELDLTPGIHPEWGRYDRIQRNLKGNHVALVDRGRMGPGARLRADGSESVPRYDAWEVPEGWKPETKTDNFKEKRPMETVKIRLDGREIEVSEVAAVVIEQKERSDSEALKKANERADKAEKDLAEKNKEAEQLQAKLDAAEKLDINALVRKRASLESAAAKVLPKEIKIDSLSDRQIKEEVVAAKLDGFKVADLKEKSDDYVDALYEQALKKTGTRNDVADDYDNATRTHGARNDAIDFNQTFDQI